MIQVGRPSAGQA